MLRKISITAISLTLLTTGVVFTPVAQAATGSCTSITRALVVADGYKAATAPKLKPYNFANTSANEANALGTTIDFGAKALVVGCVSPADIAKYSGPKKPIMSATQYLASVVKQSAGAMKKTAVGGVNDYLDFGNGKEDGVGSTAKVGSLRLDAWVAGKYVILTFSAPAVARPPAALLAFIHSTKSLF